MNVHNPRGTSAATTLAVAVTCHMDELSAVAEVINTKAYPNFSQCKMTNKFNSYSSSKYVVRVLEMPGRDIMNDIINAKEGINLHELDLSNVAKGVYMISLQSKDVNEVMRITVE